MHIDIVTIAIYAYAYIYIYIQIYLIKIPKNQSKIAVIYMLLKKEKYQKRVKDFISTTFLIP